MSVLQFTSLSLPIVHHHKIASGLFPSKAAKETGSRHKGAAVELGGRRIGGQALIKDEGAIAVNQIHQGAGHPILQIRAGV
jgi:hypothetical protein